MLAQSVKTAFFTVLFILVGLYLYTKLAGPIPFTITQTTNSNLFTVTGEGKVSSVPTKATVSLGVTQNATTEQAAKDAMNTQTNKIIADLKALGIPEKNIKTTNFSVYPNNPRDVQPLPAQSTSAIKPMVGTVIQPESFTATQNLEVQTDTTDLANKAIDVATADGANQVGGVQFKVDDAKQKELQAQARKLAIADAKKNAQELANDAGITLGRVINIQESSNQPIFYGGVAMNKAVAPDSAPTNLQAGENEVTVTVTLYYETQ